jgi:hypothetical protein
MHKGIKWATIALTCALTIAGLAGCRRTGAKAMDDVFNNLDLQKNTRLHVEEYWKTVNNQERTCSGMVVDVQRDRGGTQVLVAVPSRITFRDFNVVLTVPDVTRAAALNRRETIRFKGTLSGYKAGREGGVVLIMRGAEILN